MHTPTVEELEQRRIKNNRRSNQAKKKRNRELIAELRDKPCADCGGTFPVACMQFHHIDPTTKSFSLGNGASIRTRRQILAEAEKCVVICANCHCLRHTLRYFV